MQDKLSLSKAALIIGGSGGIGFETAKMFYEKGIRTCLTYNGNKDKLSESLRLSGMQNALALKIDMMNENSVSETVSKVLDEFGKIDIVVHCVTAPVINRKIDELTWQDFQEHIDIQIKGFFSVVKCLLPTIKAGNKIKFIVVLTEYCIGKPPVMLSHYIAAKYGLMGLVKCMASEFGSRNCTFNMVSPGMVKTGLLSNIPPKLVQISAYNNPLKRIAEPLDIAKAISFLASEDSDYLNGANITINGGNVML